MTQKKWLMAVVVVTAGVVVAAGANAQDKVIQKTTDESGFEKQLTEVDMMMQTASQLMSAGQWNKAVETLQNVVTLEPDRIEGWQELARCYNELGQYDKAAESFMKAHELQPESLDLLSNLGYAQVRAEDWGGADETYKKMLALDETSYDANVHLGFILQQQVKQTEDPAEQKEKMARAAAYYEKALEGKPDDVTTMGSLGALYADLGEQEKSIAIYEKGIENAEGDQQKQMASKLGKSLIDAKSWAKAATVYQGLVEQDPSSPAYQFNAGISLMQAEQHKAAIPYLEKTIELSPDYAQAYQYLAACYNESGQYSKAISTVQKGLKVVGPTDSKAGLYCTWGRSLEKQELYDEAIEMFQRAVNDPQYGGYAKKQIQRQEDLKKRRKMMKGS
jgi:tetratricopeptide (TPR) repeat protein